MNDRKSPFKSYRQSMTTALDPEALKRWKILVIRGDSDYLLTQTRSQLRKVWENAGWHVERIEGPQLTAENFLQAVAARSLFDPQTLTLINDAQMASELLAQLQSIKHPKELQNPLVLIWKSKDLTAKVSKELERLGMLLIPCDEPAPWEIKDFIQERQKHYQLGLTSDAVQLVFDAIGADLAKIDNELRRLSLNFAGQDGPKNAQMLQPLLDYLKEDHVFKLDQLICSGAFGKAMLLVKDLLNRGEKPLGLLAILGMHCRKALQIQAGLKSGMSQGDLARMLRLPPTVVQSYIAYAQRRKPSTFQKALVLCHEADLKLKSRSEGEEMFLNQIIFELMQ